MQEKHHFLVIENGGPSIYDEKGEKNEDYDGRHVPGIFDQEILMPTPQRSCKLVLTYELDLCSSKEDMQEKIKAIYL